MKRVFFGIGVMLLSIAANAQQFISKGKIIFERRINQWANNDGSFAEELRKSVPQFKSDIFSLAFDNGQSIYQAVGEVKNNLFNETATDNIVYSNFQKDEYIARKNIFEKTYLVKDSVPKIKWKIKDDFREIAGYNCRRATTLIFDSVFVVAFYTDEITLPGGPESFNGLPGTILGLVINRLHTTWYAARVELDQVNENTIVPPSEGEPATNKEVILKVAKKLGDFGEEAQKIRWAIQI